MDLGSIKFSNIFNFATEQARTIVYLHYFDFAISILVALTVAGLLIAVVIKFRHRPGTDEPEQSPGDVKLEAAWTLGTAAVLFALAVASAYVMLVVNPAPGPRQSDIVINAHQWWWEYRYPKLGVVTANELYMPEGVNSLLEVRGADVIHSFWVPEFGQKMDAIPGHPNYVFYKPIRKGLFIGACSEFCGADHALMLIRVNVVSPAEFDSWVQSQLKVPVASSDASAQNGARLFLTITCMECHRIAGTPAVAQVAPDLTHVSDRKTLGSCVLANNLENLTRWIMNPQEFKPACLMPNMRLSRSDAHDIAVYLEQLK